VILRDVLKTFSLLLIIFFFTGCINEVIYQPNNKIYRSSNKYNCQENNIYSDDNVSLNTKIYFSSKKVEFKGTVVVFHGNSDNISTLGHQIFDFINNGYNLFLFDYRGYGKSTGKPSQEGLNKDAKAILNYVIANYTKNNEKLIIYGQSLGGAVLLRAIKDIEEKEKISSIIVEGSFLSYKQIAEDKFIFLTSLLIDDKFSPNQIDRNLKIPILIIHSINDKIISYSHGLALHEYFKNSLFWKTYEDHISFLNYIANRKMLYKYLKNLK